MYWGFQRKKTSDIEVGNMGGKRKRVEPARCSKWMKKTEVWDILRHENFIGYMERFKGNNLDITQQFIKTWRDDSVMVGNQHMEVTEEVIAEARGLDMDSINFYQDRKLSDRAIDKFVESKNERSQLVKIGNSNFHLASVSQPWRFMLFSIMEYLTLDGMFTKLYGYHFMLANHFRHDVRINFPFYLRQSLSFSIHAIQNDPNGEHVCHEGLMVLIMNVLKSKKAMKPIGSLKAVEYDTKGSFPKKGYDSDTQDEA